VPFQAGALQNNFLEQMKMLKMNDHLKCSASVEKGSSHDGDMTQNHKLSRDQASSQFKSLVDQYGLQWTAAVPREAHDRLVACNAVLTEKDRREALGLR
jgi:hypothetical protein